MRIGNHCKNLFLLRVLTAALGWILAGRVTAQTFTTLHSFPASSAGASDGRWPYAGLILSDNTLYGTANVDGSAGGGTVFAVNTDGSGFTTLHSFGDPPSDGNQPLAGLILSDNTLYGTTQYGGSGYGTVFAVNTDGTGFTNLYSFTASPGPLYTNADGANPYAGLILSGNTLYGTAHGGGSSLVRSAERWWSMSRQWIVGLLESQCGSGWRCNVATRDACRSNALTVRTQAQSLSKLFPQGGVLKRLDQFFEASWFHHLEAQKCRDIREVFFATSRQLTDRQVVRLETPPNRAAGVLIGEWRQSLIPPARQHCGIGRNTVGSVTECLVKWRKLAEAAFDQLG